MSQKDYDMVARWYVVHTYSGYENKVKTDLEKTIKNRELEDFFFDIIVPMEEQIEIKDGKRKTNLKKVFPGYVLIKMIVTEESWYIVRNTRGVTGFVGSGTDPIEGANLAISILDYFNQKDILTIATTHYQELKNYALVTNRFENASVEFDIKTLMPTYKLLVGIPGKSNAFEISKSLGLNSEIINNAKSLMSKDQINIEELLKNIYDNKSIIEKERKEIDLKLQNISILENNLKKDNIELKQKEKELIDNAKIKARDIFLNAKEDANSIIKQMNEIKNSNVNIKDLENLRNKLNTKIKNSSLTKDTANFSSNSVEKLNVEDLKPNTEVFVKTLGQNGIIVSHISKSNEVQVKVGIIKMNVHINNIEKAHVDKTKKSDKQIQTSGYTSISKSKTVKSEINVIGLNVEEAVFVVDKFLDDCCLAKLQTVRIVHGKGTGKLKTGIHNFLKTNPHVKSYRMGTYGEGEMGVTVVTLK
mgnify:CR=1 FL=1